jgi:dipeptidyl aminopeptidase/acylaminoacyl peptidase
MARTAPFGTWNSPITAEELVRSVVSLSQPRMAGDNVVFCEARPSDAGRVVPVLLRADGTRLDLVGPGWSARTLVHEYGGACTAVVGDDYLFSNFADQRVYRVAVGSVGAPGEPVAVTPEPASVRSTRYADFAVAPGGMVYAVSEIHHGSGVINCIVMFPYDGSAAPVVVAEGHDFFSAPRVSPDGAWLVWLGWDHPNMPWDGTYLYKAGIDSDGTPQGAEILTGGPEESVSQPRWDPSGRLHYLSDRSGWWNLYADEGAGGTLVFGVEAEMGGPDWGFGQSSYTFLSDGRAVVTWSDQGSSTLARLDQGSARAIETPWSGFAALTGTNDAVLAIASSAVESPVLVRIPVDGGPPEVLARSRMEGLPTEFISRPEPVTFPSSAGRSAHALYYPPTNPDFVAPPGETPPLVVMSHGGPTGSASGALNPVVQYFTSRGVAVVDVDYGGSSGYGRAYRQALAGQWGIVDVDDCVNAALWLAEQCKADRDRLAIRGGSAGGYTTLCALAFRDVFAVGASHFGVADPSALARDTHKFESRYLDGLIGRWPDAQETYRQRSPLDHTDGLSCPVILFQGLEDKIVPPAQAEEMASALRDKGIPFAYMAFEGEQHGFRQAGTITTVIQAEFGFYGRVLGFEPAGQNIELDIENAAALPSR